MKRFLNIATLLLSIAFTVTAQTNATIGGAGICHVDQDPDNITDMQSVDIRYECRIAVNETTNEVYVYDASAAGGVRWNTIDLENVFNSMVDDIGITITDDGNGNYTVLNSAPEATTIADSDNIDLSLSGTEISALVKLDPDAGNILTSSAAGLMAEDELPVGGTNGDFLQTDGSGNYTWTTGASGEATTITDSDNIDLTLSGNDITADVILDPDSGNLITSGASGLLVEDPQSNLTVADSHSDAQSKGVPLGGTFEASGTNTMGASPGMEIKRRF